MEITKLKIPIYIVKIRIGVLPGRVGKMEIMLEALWLSPLYMGEISGH